MHISLQQTNSGFKMLYRVLINSSPVYFGSASGLSRYLPVKLSKKKEASPLYSGVFQPRAMLKNFGPRYLLGYEKRSLVFDIKNEQDEKIAQLSRFRRNILERAIEIDMGHLRYYVFNIAKGASDLLLLFAGEEQIGQGYKRNKTYNNLDQYELYVLDAYAAIEHILSIFLLYYDSIYYGRRGKKQWGTTTKWSWSIGPQNKLYNPEWFTKNFPGVAMPTCFCTT